MTTIYALATPPGKSGVAVIRISGPDAFSISERMTSGAITPRLAHLRAIRNTQGEVLDTGVVLGFAGPASFNGEDIVEFQIHGSRAAIIAVSAELENQGAVLAERGEFTRRALENGKLDMLQVESLHALIESDTEFQRKQSLTGVNGDNSAWIDGLRERAVKAMSLVALSIDFVDEELPENLLDQIQTEIDQLENLLVDELERSRRTLSLKDGFRVAILGRPNVGKSSLLNAIAGREVAIATEVPGTTRDAIEVFVDLDGLPVIFVDTAGIRETEDVVEGIGIERAKAVAINAELRVLLYEHESEIDAFSEWMQPDDLVVQSKSDIHAHGELAVSAKTGAGISDLLAKVADRIAVTESELGRFNNQRQISSLETSISAIEDAKAALGAGEAHLDLVAEHLRRAVFALDRLVGRVDVEDMLDVIFSQFCIGK